LVLKGVILVVSDWWSLVVTWAKGSQGDQLSYWWDKEGWRYYPKMAKTYSILPSISAWNAVDSRDWILSLVQRYCQKALTNCGSWSEILVLWANGVARYV
jgi:hypothetical protein